MKYRWWEEALKCLIKALTSKMIYSAGETLAGTKSFQKRPSHFIGAMKTNIIILIASITELWGEVTGPWLYFSPHCIKGAAVDSDLDITFIYSRDIGEETISCKLETIPHGLTSAMTRLEAFRGWRYMMSCGSDRGSTWRAFRNVCAEKGEEL